MSDGYRLRGRVWPHTRPDPSHAVIYLHGIQSHGGWFEWSASLLAQQGDPVILPDRRGSGMNNDARGDTPSALRWLLDIDELATWARRKFGVQRLDLVGVSWGGKLATAWALRHAKNPLRLLLVCPGFFPAVDVPFRERFRIAWALLTRSSRTFAIPLNDPELFTDNPEGLAFIANDPLKLTHATARFLWHSRRLDLRLRQAGPRSLPADTTLVLAGRDRIIRNQPTEAWFQRVAGCEARVVRFAEAAHTLEFAGDRERFRKLLERWNSPASFAVR